jgi:pimeloyl-ACP methyl ester carboxylesterase
MRKVIIWSLVVLFLLLIFVGHAPNASMSKLKGKYANEASQFVEIGGMQVHYRVEGSGMPLVLLHGTAASLHTWDAWAMSLQDSFQVIRMDLPAFGLTGPHPDQDYSIERYTSFVDQFMDELQIDTCYLAGNSLGGAIAWNYTISRPERVKKLILIDAAGAPREGDPPMIFKLARIPVVSQLLKFVTPKRIIESNLQQVYYDDAKVSDALIDRYYDMARRPGNRQAFIDRARMDFVLPTDRLAEIVAPTLILWGEQDAWIPVKDVSFFESRIPNSQHIIYPNAGHVPMEELPIVSAQDAMNFLKATN